MKILTSLSVILLTCLSLVAAPPVATPKQAWFKWLPNPADLGGMTTNDYYTNIVFRLFSVTDCTTPTNAWPEVTNWLASTFPTVDGNWTNTVVIDGSTRFYLLSVSAIGGGSAPFSNQAVSVATPPSGIIKRVGP